MRIIVVRHGQAEAKKPQRRQDAERPLVARGRRQADRLGKLIGGGRPSRVISSPALRCVQTTQPFAHKFGLAVELSEQLSADAGRAAVELCRQLLSSETDNSTVVLCTHREVLVELLPQLSEDFGRKLGHRPPGAKGGAWILRFRAGKLEKVDYHPPAA
jgi:phosphohistidine phosphatase SixA